MRPVVPLLTVNIINSELGGKHSKHDLGGAGGHLHGRNACQRS